MLVAQVLPAWCASSELDGEDPSFMAIPIVSYSTDTGLLGGAVALKSYHHERYRVSTVGVSTIYSQKKQFTFSFFVDHYFPGDRDRIYAAFKYQKYPTVFHGIGNNSKPGVYDKFTPEYVSMKFYYERRLMSSFKVKAGLVFRNQALVKSDSDGLLRSSGAPFHRGRLDAGPELSLVWDSRDNTIATQSGNLVQVIYTGGIMQDDGYGFNQVALDARTFYQPFSGVVMAFMAEMVTARGSLPFYLYPAIGGSDRLRGYEEDRFIDRSTILVQHDIRFPLWKSFGGAVFAATGRVAPDVSTLFEGQYHSAAGAGLRWYFNKEKHLVISCDFAWGSDTRGVYFNYGEAF
ncbi:BamA/TamA family outer membrane protein [Candidatus Latescibacterota bacterium]